MGFGHGAGVVAAVRVDGDPRRRRGRDVGGGGARVPPVPVLLQVEPEQLPDDQLLLYLQLRPRGQVQRRAAEMRLQRLLIGRSSSSPARAVKIFLLRGAKCFLF